MYVYGESLGEKNDLTTKLFIFWYLKFGIHTYMYVGHLCRKLGYPFLRTLPKFQHKIPSLKILVGHLLEPEAASKAAIENL